MSASAAKLRRLRKEANATSAAVDEGLLGVSRGIDRLLAYRAELLAACEAALEHIEDSQDGESGETDFFDGGPGTDARLALEAAIAKVRAP